MQHFNPNALTGRIAAFLADGVEATAPQIAVALNVPGAKNVAATLAWLEVRRCVERCGLAPRGSVATSPIWRRIKREDVV